MEKLRNLKSNIRKLPGKIKSKNISFKYLLFDLTLLLIIVTLTFNIYKAYNEGVNNLGRLKVEEEKLIKLQEENSRLSEEESYYQSIEFRKAYARDSLNLSKEGETLYLITRDEVEDEKVPQEIFYDPNEMEKFKLWKLLILGR